MKESSTYQAILEEGRLVGITIGRTEGRTEGRAEGRTEGAVAEARRILRIIGDGQFGPADAQTAATIERIADVARLEDLASRLKAASSWQELLGPASRRKKKR
jgi:predicted transposase YdaD